MYEDKRLESAYQRLLTVLPKKFGSAAAEKQFFLSIQRQFGLTERELGRVGFAAILALLQKTREKNNQDIEDSGKNPVNKAVRKVGFEFKVLPLEIKARVGKTLLR